MTIQEQLIKLNNAFESLHRDFSAFEAQKKNLDSQYVGIISAIKAKWQVEYDRQNQVKEEVLKYFRIAKDNSPKELVHSGIAAQRPDLAKLNSMIERINVNSRTDAVAGQIIDLASAYVIFLDNEVAQLSTKEQNEINNAYAKKNNEQKNSVQRQKQVISNCKSYLRGEDVKNLAGLFEMIHREYEITDDYFVSWGKNLKRKRMMLLGFSQYHVDVPQMLSGLLKSSLGKHFDESTKMVNCPCGFTTDSYEDIYAEYTEINEESMKQGIQALLLNFLRYFRPAEYKISILDYLHYNADVLGPMYVLSAMKNGIIDKVPSDAKSLKASIDLLAQYYRRVESKIGTSSVYEYNKSHKSEERIPLRILIINRESENFKSNDEPEMLYLINNAPKFGIITIRLTKSTDGGSKGKEREKKYLSKAKNFVRIISDSKGDFYIENDIEWMNFKWLTAPSSIPSGFVDKIEQSVKPVEIGTKYYNRYKMHLPERSKGKRKPISVPFAIDEDDKVISCNFENELFAAFMMGASRSGKSTLLHTIIDGLMMNYHPDELELWLLDFKILEFKKYATHMTPHIKYLLLEKSEDLVYDIIDKMTDELDRRQYVFAQNGWNKLTEVPLDVYMPVVFVIIDEFSDMSQVLKETKGMGYAADYTIKLENLLKRGAALGFKFIFASQTYTTGVSGLTEMACKQIQLRFALKNTPDEIKRTLVLTSDQLNPELSMAVADMPPYETLFKWRDESGKSSIGKFRNMYSEPEEQDILIDMIQNGMHSTRQFNINDDLAYQYKNPVLIEGNEPKTFKSQTVYYLEYEKNIDKEDMDESDVLIYAGVPCSFNLARPFTLIDAVSQNILVAGGNRENNLSIVMSIINCYRRAKKPIEIWAHSRNTTYRKYKDTVLKGAPFVIDIEDICDAISIVRGEVENRKVKEKLILVFGYEQISSDMEILGADGERTLPVVLPKVDSNAMDMSAVLEKIKNTDNPVEKKRILDEYNKQAEFGKTAPEEPKSGIYDARNDFSWIIKRASNFGVHFLLVFEQPKDFIATKLDEKAFQHKLLFSMPKDDSISIMGSRKANELDAGVCLYSDGKDLFSMRPHLYKGIPCNGWQVDDAGNVVQRK